MVLQRSGEVVDGGVLRRDVADGDDGSATRIDVGGLLRAHVGDAHVHLGEEAVDVDPALLEHAETRFGLRAGSLCSLCTGVGVKDDLARSL